MQSTESNVKTVTESGNQEYLKTMPSPDPDAKTTTESANQAYLKKQPQKITTFLTYNDQAEEAMNFYVSVFKSAKVVSASHYQNPDSGKTFMTGTFKIEEQNFMVLNGGPQFKFEQGISLFVNCETQEEVDDLWEKLSAGGEKLQCGWLKDKFGVSWQIVPSILANLLNDSDPAKTKRAMDAMMKMHKLDIATLKAAAEG